MRSFVTLAFIVFLLVSVLTEPKEFGQQIRGFLQGLDIAKLNEILDEPKSEKLGDGL